MMMYDGKIRRIRQHRRNQEDLGQYGLRQKLKGEKYLNKILSFTIDEIFRQVLDGNKSYSHQLVTTENLTLNGKSVVLRAIKE